jgi:NitT/TauT family transport system ATP-binding protein
MQQRVAVARAIACDPSLLVMDEPFTSLDAEARADIQDLVLAITAQSHTAVLMVTHDIDESVYLADRVVVLS